MENAVSRRLAASALVLAAAVAGCSHGVTGPDVVTPTEQFAIEVRQTPEELAITPSAQGLSMQQASALRNLAATWRDRGGETVTVRTPVGGDPQAAEASTRATLAALADFGVPEAAVEVVTYDARGGDARGAPVLVGFNRYDAVGPRCEGTWTHVDATFEARTSGNFGCATTANFAAQIANPRDLLRPAGETSVDAVRRQTTLGLYRQGVQSHAVRTPDERTSISDVARQR